MSFTFLLMLTVSTVFERKTHRRRDRTERESGVCLAFIPVSLPNSDNKDPNAAAFPLCNPFCPGGAVYVCCIRYLHVLGGYCNGSAAWCY